MNPLVQNGLAKPVQCAPDTGFILKNRQSFAPELLQPMAELKEDCLLSCELSDNNEGLLLKYDCRGYVSMAELLPELDPEGFYAAVMGILYAVAQLEVEQGELCRKIDCSIESIFLEPTSMQARLLCMPVKENFFEDCTELENTLRISLFFLINQRPNIQSAGSTQLSSYLSDCRINYARILDMYGMPVPGNYIYPEPAKIWDSDSQGAESIPAQNSLNTDTALHDTEMGMGNGGACSLELLNGPALSIQINKNSFTLGKNKNECDGILDFNPKISRKHCRIELSNSQWIITDLESTNGTSINGSRLEPNSGYRIENGDIIRLANSDFRVHIS